MKTIVLSLLLVGAACAQEKTPVAKSREEWLAAARGEDVALRIASADALLKLDPPETDAVLELLKDRVLDVRIQAAGAFRWVDPLPDSAIEPLLRMLRDETPVANWSACALFNARGHERRVVDDILSLLCDRKYEKGQAVMCALAAHPKAFREAVRAAIKDVPREKHTHLFWNLRSCGTSTPLLALCESVQLDPDPEIRRRAAELIPSACGEEAFGVQSLRRAVLQDADAGVREAAMRSLGNLFHDDADAFEGSFPALAAGFADKELNVRRQTTRAAQFVGKELKRLYPELEVAVRKRLEGATTETVAEAEAMLRLMKQ